jgi:hypothetical protein
MYTWFTLPDILFCTMTYYLMYITAVSQVLSLLLSLLANFSQGLFFVCLFAAE